MNGLTPAKRAQVIAALVEGNSIRATVRMTGASKNAIQRLLAASGPACEEYLRFQMDPLPPIWHWYSLNSDAQAFP